MPAPENLAIQTPGAITEPVTEQPQEPAKPEYVAKRTSSGRYVVVDESGDQVGDFKGTKAQADAEIVRLLGGEPVETEAMSEPEPPKPAAKPASQIDATKLSQPVLTAEGWLCPEVPHGK